MKAQALALDNLPTPKEERWKYTNLPRAMPADLEEKTVGKHRYPQKPGRSL
ncbi:MAG: hypothetical protein LRY57_04580 [Alphaproteobacteria bacterium]|nr:hypothetical protein [Alphaproteobacteria bacterium]